MKIFHHIFLAAAICLSICHASQHVQETLSGYVPGGNYSYYFIQETGTVIIELKSTTGDADLYVSLRTLKPTFDLEGHDFQSNTCGLDVVMVPSSKDRPIAIGVYGHPSHDLTDFELKIDVFSQSGDDVAKETNEETSSHKAQPSFFPNAEPKDNTSLWSVMLYVLQLVMDLLLECIM